MNGFRKFFSVLSRISLTLMSLFAFAFAFFFSALVVLGEEFYLYPQGISVELIVYWVIAAILLFAIMVLLLIYYWKTIFHGSGHQILSFLLVIIYFIMLSKAGGLSIAAYAFMGPQGHSYTEDIENYGAYDFSYSPAHFPKAITEDMEVIKYSYFYKRVGTHQTDIYLEVRFDSKEKFDLYLNEAIEAFGENGVYTYENPYDSSFTDVIEKDCTRWIPRNDIRYAAVIEMVTDDTYKYVDIIYRSVSYSQDELIIIYNLTDLGDGIEASYYYPAYLKRFGVEFDAKNNFVYEYTEEAE